MNMLKKSGNVEGLLHQNVRACRFTPFGLPPSSRDNDDRKQWIEGREPFQQAPAISGRHAEIQEQQIDMLLNHPLDGILTIIRENHVIALDLQCFA